MFYTRHNQLAVMLAAIALAFFSLGISSGGSWIFTTTDLTTPSSPNSVRSNLHIDPAGGLWGKFPGEFCGSPSTFPQQSSMTYTCRTRDASLAFGILATVTVAFVLFYAIVYDDCHWYGWASTLPISLGFFLAGAFGLICFVLGYVSYREFYLNVVNLDWEMDYSFALVIAAWIICWLASILYCCYKRRYDVLTNPGLVAVPTAHGAVPMGAYNTGYTAPYNAPYGVQPLYSAAPALG